MGEYDITVGVLKETGYFGGLLAENGINVVRLPGFWPLFSYLKSNKFDIIHSCLYRANVVARIAGRLAGVPAVISSRRAIDKWRAPWQVLLDRITDGLADKIICNSKAAQAAVINEGYPEQRTEVVYNGIDETEFNTNETKHSARQALNLPFDKPVALITSRLHNEKGADLIPMIAEKMPGVIFLVAGDGPLKSSIIDRANKLGIAARFHFLGWRKDVARLMRAADFMLMPSREESFPQAALEAAACGLPVVGFDIGGMRELIDDGQSGFLVSYMNIQAFIDAANILASDTGRACRMGQLAREKSRSFTMKNMFEKTEVVYRALLYSGETSSR
jgi:glycosyltransferase involved in cell wall biosynthesis